MMPDISGFTRLTAYLNENSPNGAEQMAGCLSTYFGWMNDIILDHGGDVLKFAGDALVCSWVVESLTEMQQTLLNVLHCAMVLTNKLDRWVVAPGVDLSLHIGVDCGQCTEMFLGGVDGRWEYSLTADFMQRLGKLVDGAEMGSTMVSSTVWAVVRTAPEVSDLKVEEKNLDGGGGEKGVSIVERKPFAMKVERLSDIEGEGGDAVGNVKTRKASVSKRQRRQSMGASDPAVLVANVNLAMGKVSGLQV
jgi:class 3 adenylate cyclase